MENNDRLNYSANMTIASEHQGLALILGHIMEELSKDKIDFEKNLKLLLQEYLKFIPQDRLETGKILATCFSSLTQEDEKWYDTLQSLSETNNQQKSEYPILSMTRGTFLRLGYDITSLHTDTINNLLSFASNTALLTPELWEGFDNTLECFLSHHFSPEGIDRKLQEALMKVFDLFFEQAPHSYYPVPAIYASVKVEEKKTGKEIMLRYKLTLEKEKIYTNHIRIKTYCNGIDDFIEHIYHLITDNEEYKLILSDDCREIEFD